MQGNFSINLPSIPTNSMKFKIQDVKLKGFLSKDARFKDDKTYLTKRFINSFPNLFQKVEKKSQETQENKSQLSTISSIIPNHEQVSSRWMIGDDKKNLLLKYEEKYKSYNSPLSSQFVNNKGYSFGKQGLKDALDGEMKKYQSAVLEVENKRQFENYYFNQTFQSDSDEQELQREIRREQKLKKMKKIQASPVFKSQDRWKFGDRILSSKIEPGPGSYLVQTPKINKIRPQKTTNPEIQGIDFKKIKRILGSFSCQQYEQKKIVEKKSEKQPNHQTSSFILGNHDRFGAQVYPISNKINVPGPGSYQFHNSLEQKANKILILEQQRKLLKEWHES